MYDDVEQRGLYEMLWSTRYFGCLVWHLLMSGTVNGLLKHTINKERYICSGWQCAVCTTKMCPLDIVFKLFIMITRLSDAGGLVRLHLLCYPGSDFAISLDKQSSFDKTSDIALVKVREMNYCKSDALMSACVGDSYIQAFCEHYGLSEMSENLLKIKDRNERHENADSKEQTEHSALS